MRPLLVLLAVGMLAPGIARAQLAPGDHTFRLSHDGQSRSYLMRVPARPAVAGIVVALHGGGGNAAQLKREIGLDAIADREGFVTVYPNGTGPFRNRLLTWNASAHCCGRAFDNKVDDVGFLAAVIGDVRHRVNLPDARVVVTGHSNGAMMAHRLAAERAELVRAIVPVGGAMDLTSFQPSRSVAVLHIHSVDDPRALYGGGTGPAFPGTNRRSEHAPVTRGLEAWARHNGCSGGTESRDSASARASTGEQTAVRVIYRGCPSGAEVEHLRLTGVGHGWPGVSSRRDRIIGPSTTLISATEEVWRFARRAFETK